MTNKIVLRSVEEVMNDYKPVYQPIWPLLLEGGQQHPAEEGTRTFKRVEAMGDLRAKHLGAKDTVVHEINAGSKSKTFKAYFLGSQYIQSKYQGQEGNETVVAQVLEEMNKQFDEMILLGEGTANNNVVNNALFWSGDTNLTTESSAAIASTDSHLTGLHAQIMTNAQKADQLSGQKLVLVYGTTALLKLGAIYSSSGASFIEGLNKGLGSDFTIVRMPTSAPLSGNGIIIVNKSQIKAHYVATPELEDQGVNAEKKYTWHNFGMGSVMIDVLNANGVIKQALTFS